MRMERALLNNVAWCAAVTGAHGVRSEVRRHYWSADGAVPPYYSNLITLTGEEGTRAQLDRIRELGASPPKPGWSVKDSFARLDLREFGLRVLFEAHWYGLDAAPAAGPETGLRFATVDDPAGLERWEDAWQLSSPAPGRVFPPVLLSDPDVAFLAAMREGEIAGGAVANLSEGAVGLSNVYALEPAERAPLLRDCARELLRLHPDRAVVGYGPQSELEDLASLGFLDLGPLRVWESP